MISLIVETNKQIELETQIYEQTDGEGEVWVKEGEEVSQRIYMYNPWSQTTV